VVLAVAEQLGLMDGVFVGWSLGGNILLEASDRLSRAAGLMIIGTVPLGFPPALAEAVFPHPAFGFNFQADLSKEEIEAFARALFRPGADQVSDYVADIRRADGRARQIVGPNLQTGDYRDEIAIVAQLTTPLAVVYGEQEQFVNRNYTGG
jgi:pimeloyl-ACP methyl ester carboxylesterase